MEFINGCTTNVHVLESFAATPFIHYTPKEQEGPWELKTQEAQQAVNQLRNEKVLCACVGQDIWLFGQVQDRGLRETWDVASDGVVEGQKEVIQLLLDAIEAALAHALAQDGQLTHIAPWTWIYWDDHGDDVVNASLITLCVKDTANGALYLLPETMPTSWLPLDQASQHASDEVLLAPHGRIANIAQEDAKDAIVDEQWKAYVVDALRMEGISLDDNTEWTDVDFAEDGTLSTCAWPSQLCLVRQNSHPPSQVIWEDPTEWQRWADNGPGRTYRDPLAEAEEWFIGSAERKRLAAEETARQEAATDSNVPTSTAIATDVNMMTSPPFMQRTADHQAALSGIYPTPPDGLAQQGQAQLGAQMVVSAATPTVHQPGDAFPGIETTSDAQNLDRDSAGLDNFPMDEAEEDLFGDVGGGMFEENEVGDADFDYFDEPDDAPAAESLAEGVDTQMTGVLASTVRPESNTETTLASSDVGNGDILHPQELDVELVSSPAVPMIPSPEEANHLLRGNEDRRALSPFGIRERLLPPPVPASVVNNSNEVKQPRKSSSFAPIMFRDGVDLGAKYADRDIISSSNVSVAGPNIGLPPSRTENGSDDESDESGSSDRGDEEGLPPRLPWENTKKRKRSWAMADSGSVDVGTAWAEEMGDVYGSAISAEQQQNRRAALLNRILSPASQTDVAEVLTQPRPNDQHEREDDEEELPSLEELYDLDKEDLICIAQIIGEQANTCITTSFCSGQGVNLFMPETLLTKALDEILPNPRELCDLTGLALTRDPAPPPRTNTRAPVPPRPNSEVPDIFHLPAPFIRIQRNSDNWEMLPPALSFWEPNGLSPASGPKNIKARAVFPSNSDLQMTMRGFMAALGRSYEGCKLGSHYYRISDDGERDAGSLVEVEAGETASREALLRAYEKTCIRVGKEMAVWVVGPSMGWEGTLVVYIVDPFGGSWKEGRKFLCACFWKIFLAYKDRLNLNQKGGTLKEGVPDVVLQLLPMELVAGMDRLVVPDPAMLAKLAREVYDRCPLLPGREDEGEGASAPSILLAPPVPKRIAFQLLADVSTESLLQDGRVLHLAIAMSGDREWMSCVWSNGQGRVLLQESFCLRGSTVGAVVRDGWARTGELLGQVRVGWRVFMVLDEGIWHGTGLERVWRNVVTAGRVGGTTVCVTLVKVRGQMGLRVTGEETIWDGAVGLATPASTPVAFPGTGGATTGTNSPNIGASDGFGAPLTPAGSESTANATAAAMLVAENDPDAHLVEVEDESCGVLFKPHCSALAGLDGMANGAVIRKGEGAERGVLGVSLCWTVQVKPQGAVDMGNMRQAEITLREVLKMFRALTVLTRARGLDQDEAGLLPVHLAVACKGAKGLEGMFSDR